MRYVADARLDDRLLIVNLGRDVHRPSIADPLVAPPLDFEWEACWSSEDAAYGGRGTPPLWSSGEWNIPGESAVVLRPGERRLAPRRGIRRRTA
jgi:maltooligosyltrehalose trehalohydrolase